MTKPSGNHKGNLYFIGIAGHTMRGLALAARELGFEVTGFDPTAVPPGSDWLDGQGITWWREFKNFQLDQVTAVIVTGAHISDQAPVVVAARERHIPIKSYAQLFGELTEGKHVIDVSGTHGKTTTTALIAWLLESAGRHPDFLIGIQPFNFNSSVRLTGSNVVVAEGDEYRASPLETKSKVQYHHPDTLVLTSVEHDHPDFFPDLQAVTKRFQDIVAALPKSGRLVAWAESTTVVEVAHSAAAPVTTYGLGTGDYTARNIAYLPTGIEFDIENHTGPLGRFATMLYGKHNVLNSLAATAAALSEGLTIKQIIAAGATFMGTYRRFNLMNSADARIVVIDDYGHHPTEVATNLEAAKLHFPGRRILAIVRPHTYSRTKALLPQWQHGFGSADLVYITDIEGAREAGADHTVSGNDIVQALKMPAIYTPSRNELIAHVSKDAKPGDVIICFTVSGYDQLAEDLTNLLNPEA
jgi:UDP-N-acetylmuramate--L-alanine ligase